MKHHWTLLATTAFALLVAFDASATVIYESATLGPVGQLAGVSVTDSQWPGVKFTLATETRITRLGAHYTMMATDGFIGIFPIEAGTGLPPEPAMRGDALVTAPLPPQSPSAETGVAVDIILPAGTYAVVVGSSSVFSIGVVTVNNPNIATPDYIIRAGSGWNDGAVNSARFFVEATFCGDDVVEAPEQCEDLNLDNTDACLDTCAAASCGDGFVHAGVEDCDDGDANSDSTPDACRSSCVEASCGDGVIDTAEECDDGADNGAGDCTDECISVPGEGGGGAGAAGAGGGAGQGGAATGGSGEGGASDGGGPEGGASTGGSAQDGGGGASPGVEDDGGCGCRVVGAMKPVTERPSTWSLTALVAAMVAAFSRRRRRQRHGASRRDGGGHQFRHDGRGARSRLGHFETARSR